MNEGWTRVVRVLVAISVITSASRSHAQTATETERAERLFREASVLVERGAYAEACPRFEESQRLDPALGTQYNLALCYERTGRLGSAWRNLRAVERLARAAGKKGREDIAGGMLRELRSRTAHLVLVTHDADATVKVDNETVDREDMAFYAVDPGPHVIVVTAPAKQAFERRVTIDKTADGRGHEIRIDVPTLAVAVGPTRVVVVPDQQSNGRRTLGFVVGTIGVVGLGVGAATGVMILNAKSTADEACTPGCENDRGRDAVTTGETLVPVNALAFAVGLVGLTVGGFLVLTSSAKKPVATLRGSSTSGWAIGGMF